MQERFTIAEAAAKLNISTSGLENWINQAKLRRAVDEQRMENDMRAHYLTRPQLEQLATLHRRTLKDDDIEQRFAALEKRLERLEALIADQGGASEGG